MSTETGDMRPQPEGGEIGTLEKLFVMGEVLALSIAGIIGFWFLLLTSEAVGDPRTPNLIHWEYGVVATVAFVIAVYLHSQWE